MEELVMKKGDPIYWVENSKVSAPFRFSKAILIRDKSSWFFLSDWVSLWNGKKHTGMNSVDARSVDNNRGVHYSTYEKAFEALDHLVNEFHKASVHTYMAGEEKVNVARSFMKTVKDIDLTEIIYGPEFNGDGKRVRREKIFDEKDKK